MWSRRPSSRSGRRSSKQIERAQIASDVQTLIDVRTDCRQWLDGVLTDRQRAPVRYAVAYANWRLPSPSLAVDDDARDELGDEAVELLEKNIEARVAMGHVVLWTADVPSAKRRERLPGKASCRRRRPYGTTASTSTAIGPRGTKPNS